MLKTHQKDPQIKQLLKQDQAFKAGTHAEDVQATAHDQAYEASTQAKVVIQVTVDFETTKGVDVNKIEDQLEAVQGEVAIQDLDVNA
ncbi:unnamed protein product [Lactuca virosa]|uniref:Uncharacterized protein n=1 Tax=Lactuca virosa TaxID=75947 RepID=A0AAU9M8L6_9ASTR|nr:unnamed protein product [Lactuca virosa]